MTLSNPAQYISGRTVQEQMNSLIDYVDQRAADVALDAIASDVAQVHQDMLDADADASAAAASAAAAAGTLANAVKKTGEASQTIAGNVAVAGALSGGSVATAGNATVGGTLGVTGASTFTGAVTVPTPSNNTDAATKKYVDDSLAGYAPMVRTSGNQNIAGVKTFTTQIVAKTSTISARQIAFICDGTENTSPPESPKDLTKMAWRDQNDLFLGDIGLAFLPNGSTTIYIRVRNTDGTVKNVTLGSGDVI